MKLIIFVDLFIFMLIMSVLFVVNKGQNLRYKNTNRIINNNKAVKKRLII